MKDETLYLITKADDLGSSESANRAFIDGYRRGILRNGVIMMPCAYARDAAELFRNENGFSMGLHLTMNAEWDHVKWGPVLPAEKVPSLVDQNGYFFQTTQLLHDNKPRMEEFLAEMQAQLDSARANGLDIKYADAHMNFPWVLDGLGEEMRNWCERNGLACDADDFEHLPQADCGGDSVERLIARLQKAKAGLYYIHMGHPAYDTPEMRTLGHMGYENVAEEREWDRRTILDDRILDYCKVNGVVPVTLEEAYGLK